MINHHLSEEMILAYAAGSLPMGHALVVSCHLEVCPHCAKRLAQAEAIGGALLEKIEPVPVNEDAFDQLMQSIDALEAEEASEGPEIKPQDERPIRLEQGNTPATLEASLGVDLNNVNWKMVGPGIRQYVIDDCSSEGEKVRLLKLSPGFVTPEHSHHGSEMTMVLKGSFSDETGRYRIGDIQEADGSIHHQPVADTEEDCICLTVTDAPLEFKGVVSRLLQPIIGI